MPGTELASVDTVALDSHYFSNVVRLILKHDREEQEVTPVYWKQPQKDNKRLRQKMAKKQKVEENEKTKSDNTQKNTPILGKRKREESNLDQSAKERLRNKILELREQRKADEKSDKKNPKKVQKTSAASTPQAARTETQRTNSLSKKLENNLNSKKSKEKGEESINFGTFDYTNGKAKPRYLNQTKNKRANYELLKKVEEEKKKMQELKRTEEGKEVVLDQKLDLAMRKVLGEKIKDDPTKIKKSIKRKERQVAKSREKHAEKKRMEKAAQTKKIKQREENIKNRIASKKGKGVKKGKSTSTAQKKRPGFEGKKKGFINK